MLQPRPELVKASRVRDARMSLNETHCMIRSPFITATSQQETLERLEVFSEEVQEAVQALYEVAGKSVPADSDREKSVEAIVKVYSAEKDAPSLEARLNKVWLETTGLVQQSLVDLENNIVHQRKVPNDQMDKTLSHMTRLGYFVDAVPQIYKRTL